MTRMLRNRWFSHETLKITASEYSLHRRKVALGPMFRILFYPSHFNDLEKAAVALTTGTELRGKRHGSLRAEVKSLLVSLYWTLLVVGNLG